MRAQRPGEYLVGLRHGITTRMMQNIEDSDSDAGKLGHAGPGWPGELTNLKLPRSGQVRSGQVYWYSAEV
jgi:hypothetical protein